MTDSSMTPDTPASEPLPVVAWSYIPSDAWRDRVLTDDPAKVEIALGFGREVEPLVRESDAQAIIARLTSERDEWRETANGHFRELAIANAQLATRPDPDAVMRLADALRPSVLLPPRP